MSVARTERRPRGELSRVLVVDDEADIRELIDLTLARMGLATECAGSVAEALAALQADEFQLCLTDCACLTVRAWRSFAISMSTAHKPRWR